MRPHRRQPTRLPRPWDSPDKNTGVGCHFLLQCVKVKSLSRVRLFVTPWTAAHQAPLSVGFSRQEYWSGVPLPSPLLTRDLSLSTSRRRAESQSHPLLLHLARRARDNNYNQCGPVAIKPRGEWTEMIALQSKAALEHEVFLCYAQAWGLIHSPKLKVAPSPLPTRKPQKFERSLEQPLPLPPRQGS